MNRRDVITILLILLWGALSIFLLPRITTTTVGLMAYFTLGSFALMACLIILLALSLIIKKFGNWGDKKIFGK